MIWCKIIISLFVLFAVQFNEIDSFNIFSDYEIPIILSFAKNDKNQKKFQQYVLEYDAKMESHTYDFEKTKKDKFKEMIGNSTKIIFFFLGYEAEVKYLDGSTFVTTTSQSMKNGACSCVVSYKYLEVASLQKFPQYINTLKKRVPKVIEMMIAFIMNIIKTESILINDLDSVYLSGFCLGGAMASNLGYALQQVEYFKHLKQMVAAVWVFDPPHPGFPVIKHKNGTIESEPGQPRRAQKGDATVVIVFHTSALGVQSYMADIDIKVNDGKNQPGCENSIGPGCNHGAALTLRALIVSSNVAPEHMNGTASGIDRSNGSPVVYWDKCNALHPGHVGHDGQSCVRTVAFTILFTDPPKNLSGICLMHMLKVPKPSENGTVEPSKTTEQNTSNKFSFFWNSKSDLSDTRSESDVKTTVANSKHVTIETGSPKKAIV